MAWYEIRAQSGNVGTNRARERTLYLRANDVVDALQRYKRVPTVKENFRISPTIKEMPLEEQTKLEDTFRKHYPQMADRGWGFKDDMNKP